MKVPIIGSSPAPEPTALKPSTFDMNCGRYSSAAKKMADASRVAIPAARKRRLARTDAGHQSTVSCTSLDEQEADERHDHQAAKKNDPRCSPVEIERQQPSERPMESTAVPR